MTNRVFRKDADVVAAVIALGIVSNADFADEQLIRIYDFSSLNTIEKALVTSTLLSFNYTFAYDE